MCFFHEKGNKPLSAATFFFHQDYVRPPRDRASSGGKFWAGNFLNNKPRPPDEARKDDQRMDAVGGGGGGWGRGDVQDTGQNLG